MWERIETLRNFGIYRDKDPEGRTCYAISRDHHDGASVEPSGREFYSLERARAEARKRSRAELVVSHYYPNPSQRRVVKCSTMSDAREELNLYGDGDGVSILSSDGIQIARRDWSKKRIQWG